MGIADPSGFNMLTNIMNSVGTQASQILGGNRRRPPGLKGMAGTFGALSAPPATALPGGGTLNQGVSTELAKEETPAAELPLFQGQQQEKIAAAGLEGGATNLGATADILGEQYRSQLASLVGPLLKNLGIPGSDTISGGGDILMKLLSSAP